MFQSREHVVNTTFRVAGWISDLNIQAERRRESLCCHNLKYRRLLRWRAGSSTKVFINNFLSRSLLSLFIPLLIYFFSRKVASNACATIAYVCSLYYDSLTTFWLWPIFRETGVSTVGAGAPHAKQQQANM